MNILNIIKKAPKDHVYYCLINDDCYVEITNGEKYPIIVRNISDTCLIGLTEEDKYFADSEIPGGDCILFPSRDNRDWEAFERELDGKPDWEKHDDKYVVRINGDNIISSVFLNDNFILAFPTEEVRDKFAETFKDLIEEAKELL